jgi:hypothetical protein
MAPRWQYGWIRVARPGKKERQGNHLLYAKPEAVSMRTVGLKSERGVE